MEVELASIISRSYVVFDHLLAGIVGVIIGTPVAYFFQSYVTGIFPFVLTIAVLIATVGYFTYFEMQGGRTPVKQWADLKVVTQDGRDIGFRESAIRNTVRVVDMSTFYLTGIGFALASPYSQRIGDYLAGTVVVDTDQDTGDYQVFRRDTSLQLKVTGGILTVLGLLPAIGFLVKLVALA